MSALTTDELVRLRDSITPGPWYTVPSWKDELADEVFANALPQGASVACTTLFHDHRAADANAHAISHLPDLLDRAIADAATIAAKDAELIRLRGEVEAMRAVVETALAAPTTGESHE